MIPVFFSFLNDNKFSCLSSFSFTMETIADVRAAISSNDEPKPFLQRFKPSLVPIPGTWPDNYVPGKDPICQSHKGTLQLVDPFNDQVIAIWDCAHNLPFFFSKGFLQNNTNCNQEEDYKFEEWTA